MMPSPTELHYFLQVASTLNVSRAAERLGISQPTLSIAIRRLEEAFGAPLLIRSKSGVRLTHGGQKLVPQARTLILEWERIRNDANKQEAVISGRYVIGCHPSVALYSAPHFLPQIMKENPSLEVQLVHDLSRRITEDVISFKVDFGVVVNAWKHPDLVIKQLATDEVSLWTGPKLNPNNDPYSGSGVLVSDQDLLQTQSILKQMEKSDMVFHRSITTSSLELIASLVACGSGVGILPSRVAKRIKEYGLKPIGKDSPTFHDRISLIFRADVQKTKASRSLAQRIEELLKAAQQD